MTTRQLARMDALEGVDLERLRRLLCELQDHVQREVGRVRREQSNETLSEIVEVTEADTIFRIDRVGEQKIADWFGAHWPGEWPVEVVLEGSPPLRFPSDSSESPARLRCLIDPIDGTRSLMTDKRSAWVLCGLAPDRGPDTRLSDIVVAAMTELPTSKQTLADQLSGVRGRGLDGIVAERVDLASGVRRALTLSPSRATDLHQGFASVARFFPPGKVLLAQFEAALLERLYGEASAGELEIFEDQYICSGGQIAELLLGRDRLVADLRPLAFEKLGLPLATACHPYDVCTELLLREAGCPISDPYGARLDSPLDTTTPVAWVGYASQELRDHIEPAFIATVREFFGDR